MLVLFSDNICYLIYYTSNQIHCLDFCLTRLLKNLLFKMADVTKNCVIHRTQNCEEANTNSSYHGISIDF